MTTIKKTAEIGVEPERLQFKLLLAQNPNYFGNIVNSPFKPVKTILGNTTYEEISCIGFNPDKDLLEATIMIRQPAGYGTGLCQTGTWEYVRFYVDYGSGWEDAGVVGVNVHDLPNINDCSGSPDKPLTYVVSRAIDPKRHVCFAKPVLPRVRAVLSWNHIPPSNTPNWPPVWGNVVERHIQITPRAWLLSDVVSVLSEGTNLKLKLPSPLQSAAGTPIPVPDPAPLTAVQLAALYSTGPRAPKTAEGLSVPAHRFGFHELQPAIASPGFSQESVAFKIGEWKNAGIDWAASMAGLTKTSGDTQYEQLHCLGLDYQREWLVATFTVRQPMGYLGGLCDNGSIEYVSFWADWDNTCQWQYIDTVQVRVHDIPSIPADGLQYSAILPLDLTNLYRSCSQPRIGRVRAVLSWNTPPSATDPDALPHWGNRLDAHVQVRPGDAGDTSVDIRAIGGIAIETIDTATTGCTLADGTFWFEGVPADAWGLNRPCPFGGQIRLDGHFFLGHKYQIRVRRAADPESVYQIVTNPFQLKPFSSAPAFTQNADADGFFTYVAPDSVMQRTLGLWNSSGDELWAVQLLIADMASPPNIQEHTPWYLVQLDNTAPVALITPDIGECRRFTVGSTITGHFTAADANFGGYLLSTQPNTATTPSNQPVATTGEPGTTPTSPGHDTWKLYTADGTHPDAPPSIDMRACGYVVRIDVSDRSIVNSDPNGHNPAAWETGFCLVDQA